VAGEQGSGEGAGGELAFEKAEYSAAPAPFACAFCNGPVIGEYYDAGGKFVCSRCRDAIESPSGGGRFLIAAALGTGAAVIGGLLWFAVRRITGYEIGLVAIVVGLMVGIAVQRGAKGRGGPRYQALAIFLTYTGIALNYAPDVTQALLKGADESAATAASAGPSAPASTTDKAKDEKPITFGGAVMALVAFAFIVVGLSYAAPFLGGIENIIGLLIIGFALFEAWKINRRVPLQGPYRTGVVAPAAETVG